MTSAFSDRFAVVGVSCGFRHNAESVTLQRDDDSIETVTAIANLGGEEWNEIDHQWERTGSIDISASVVVSRSDQWTVRGEIFKVRRLHLPDSGMRQVELIAIRKTGARP